MNNFRLIAEEKKMDYRLLSPVPSLYGWVDRDKFEKIFFNLLSNAFKYTPAGKAITVKITPTDVMMPLMDGLDMIRQIKENTAICHIPIIVLSSKASLDDRIAGLEQGIDDYITKPFSSTYLKTRIASLLRQRKALQEMYMNRLMERDKDSVSDIPTPSQPQIAPYDEQFMQKVMEFMEAQMDNAELTIDEFAEHLLLSRTIFYRKLKSIIGLTPVDFIREIRIKRSVQLIDSGAYNFSQVAYMTGFNDPKYFSKCFKKVMGITPSEYKEKKK